MKLYEIAPSIAKFEPQTGKEITPRGDKELGTGYFARVTTTDDEPGTVHKTPHDYEWNLETDAYYQYVKMIVTNERLSQNPFFPKIYDVEVIEHPEGTKTYTIDMERLHPFNSLSQEESVVIGTHLFEGFDTLVSLHKRHNMLFSDEEGIAAGKSIITPRKLLLNSLTLPLRTKLVYNPGTNSSIEAPHLQLRVNVKNSHLKQAMLFLKKLVASNPSFYIDIHDQNIMVRRGPHLPQLVFTDPIAH